MNAIPGGVVRRVLAVSAVVALASVSACGGSTSSAPSSETSAGEPARPGAAADGTCGGGDLETQVVRAADGVRLTIPADWRVESGAQGGDVRLFGPDEDAVEGQVVVQDKDQSLAEAIKDVERLNSTTEQVGERDLELNGFEASRLLVFEGEDYTDVTVVAVGRDGLRVIAYVILEGVPEEQATVESCLSALSRTS